MFGRIRKWYDGSGWFVGIAGILFVVAIVAVIALAQSPLALLWTGTQATGYEQNGLVYWHYQGELYSLPVNGNASVPTIRVYFDSAEPENAMINDWPARIPGILLVGVPVITGVFLLVAGGTRNYRWARRNRRQGRPEAMF